MSITITGTNDTATVSSESRSLTEGSTAAEISSSGTLVVSDADDGEAHTVPQTVSTTYGTFNIDANGAWTYVANGAHDELNVGDVVNETFTVASQDGTGSGTVSITITGTNDTATFSSAVVALSETNAALTTSGTLTSTDVDNPNNTFTPSTAIGAIGSFSIDAAGAWSFTANSAFDSLNVGNSVTETYNVTLGVSREIGGRQFLKVVRQRGKKTGPQTCIHGDIVGFRNLHIRGNHRKAAYVAGIFQCVVDGEKATLRGRNQMHGAEL